MFSRPPSSGATLVLTRLTSTRVLIGNYLTGMNEDDPIEEPTWALSPQDRVEAPAWTQGPRYRAALPVWPPSPREPVRLRVVRFLDENQQPQQIREEDQVQPLRQELQDLQDEFSAFEESRDHYCRQTWRMDRDINNLMHSHRLLEADLQDNRQREFRAREDLGRVQKALGSAEVRMLGCGLRTHGFG
jgi:hypothetical protein